MNQDPLINPKVMDNYRPWMLALSKVRRHQNSQYHREDVGKKYEKDKNSGPQRQPMKNQTSNGRVSRFNTIKSTDGEESHKISIRKDKLTESSISRGKHPCSTQE